MKILMLTDKMHVGGAETHVFELSRLLSSAGHTVLVASEGGATAKRLASLGIRHTRLADALDLATAKALADLVRRERPHVVHAHTRRRALLCHALARHLPFPRVFTAHARFSDRFPLDKLSRFPSHVIAVSPDVSDHLVSRFGVPRKTITLIGNGIDTRRFCPDESGVREIEVRPFTILSVSRQDRDSDLAARLLCALAPRLERTLDRPLRILIAGGGERLSHLRALARRANALCRRPVVFLLGAVDDPLPLLREGQLFVGVSRAALEAMSVGLPVILCGNEGYLGILRSSILSAAENTNFCARGGVAATPDRLFADLLAVARLPERARARLGQFGRSVVKKSHAAEEMARRTEAVYRRAVADFKKSRRTDVVLCGYYGYGNCGDELILRRVIAEQKARNPALRLGVLCADGTSPAGTVGIPRYHIPAVMDALRHSGGLILGGGSLLQDTTSRRSLLYYLALIRVAHRMGLPVMLYANGIGPLSPWGLALCRRILPLVDVISLRDRDSYQLVKRMALPSTRVTLGADPVFATCSAEDLPSRPLRRIALFPKGGSSKAEQLALADGVAAVARALDLDVAIATMNPAEDGEAAERITRHIVTRLADSPRHATATSSDPDAIIRLVGRSSLVIGERLHALILAAGSGVPAVGISRDPKIASFFLEIGKSNCLCNDLSPQGIVSASRSAIISPPKKRILAKLGERAHADADLLAEFIARRS